MDTLPERKCVRCDSTNLVRTTPLMKPSYICFDCGCHFTVIAGPLTNQEKLEEASSKGLRKILERRGILTRKEAKGGGNE